MQPLNFHPTCNMDGKRPLPFLWCWCAGRTYQLVLSGHSISSWRRASQGDLRIPSLNIRKLQATEPPIRSPHVLPPPIKSSWTSSRSQSTSPCWKWWVIVERPGWPLGSFWMGHHNSAPLMPSSVGSTNRSGGFYQTLVQSHSPPVSPNNYPY